jgi:predicted transcriptional regulator of viral defense system
MNGDLILKLYSRPETVFTVAEIAQLLPGVSAESLTDRLYYFTKAGKLKRLRHGLYAKQDYNPLELANKVYRPSYISLETVLARAGITFQYYRTIFLVSYLTREIRIAETNIQYRRIKPGVLTNPAGIEPQPGYFIATPERAFLDAVYIYKNYHFDNLGAINWEKAQGLKNIYKSKILEKRLAEYYKIYQDEL